MEGITFDLQGSEYIELNQLLKITNLVQSGGQANMFITDGEVKVNNEIETRKRNKIKAGFKVEFDGRVVTVK